jgi:hypothetical protein
MPPSRNDIRNDNYAAATAPAVTSAAAALPRRNDIRNDNTPTSRCPVCGDPFTPIRRQRYCTPACRQAAWRTRHPAPTPIEVLPPATRRRDITVYSCPDCGTRRLGQQWCPDCTRPTVRLDLGGLCPHCDEPITISDITDQHPQHGSTR